MRLDFISLYRCHVEHQQLMTEAEFRAAFLAWCERKKAEQKMRRAARAVRMRRLCVRGPSLPAVRVWIRGPKWQRLFGIPRCEPPRSKFFLYDFAEDVRELACEQLRHDVYAEWSDPREWLQARR